MLSDLLSPCLDIGLPGHSFCMTGVPDDFDEKSLKQFLENWLDSARTEYFFLLQQKILIG